MSAAQSATVEEVPLTEVVSSDDDGDGDDSDSSEGEGEGAVKSRAQLPPLPLTRRQKHDAADAGATQMYTFNMLTP